MKTPSSNSLLLIVSGPTGSGKTTLCDRMLADYEGVERVVTSTTRDKRAGEVDEVDYYFFTPDVFSQKIEKGDFYEYAQVHKRYYGTLKEEIDGKLARNLDLLLNIDVQGAAAFRKAALENEYLAKKMVTVFIRPKNLDELKTRLIKRGDDDEEEIARRLQSAQFELEQAEHYDHVIESKTKEEDYSALVALFEQEKRQRA